MLVLTRKVGEQLVIDGNIVVTVISIDGGKVRLGVLAPKSVRVDREEVHQRRQEELNDSIHAVGTRETVLA